MLLLLAVVVLSVHGESVSLAELRPEDVAEGPCIYPFPQAVSPTPMFTLAFLRNANTPYYIPMGSQHLYRAYASYLLGRNPISEDELNLMNLRIRGSASHTWRTSGYSQSFYQQCGPYGHFFRAYCIAGFGSPATDLSRIRQTTDTLIYTDNKTVLVFVRCVMGRENDWKVLSTRPELEEGTKLTILEKIKALGFNESLAAYHKYYEYEEFSNEIISN